MTPGQKVRGGRYDKSRQIDPKQALKHRRPTKSRPSPGRGAYGAHANIDGKNASRLAADGDGLQLKMAATQQRGHSDELAGRQVLGGEVSSIDAVEFIKKRQVGA